MRVIDHQFGPYRLDGLLGRGGMGEVYRAYDTAHQRVVAIKMLLEPLSADPEYRARFEREARIAAGLREQHIIPIHRYGEIDDRLYIDMRFVEGEDLGKVLARERALAPRRAVGIVAQIASALDAAHWASLIHRDVKPANVLLADRAHGRTDSVYLVDFGIARESAASTKLTMTGAAVGTPDYMAPERFTSDVTDHRADIYALGCLLYEMLTGSKPFVGPGYPALLFKHLNEEPPRPSLGRPGIPAALDEVIARSMAKQPQARYSTAGDLATAAEAALTSDTGAHPTRPVRGDAPHRKPATRPITAVPAPSTFPRPTPATAPASSDGTGHPPVVGGTAAHDEWVPLGPGRRWAKWFYSVDAATDRRPMQVWPTATDYVRAVQAAAEPVGGTGLRGARLVRDQLGMPASSSGQNAVVFALRHSAGDLALRCFTRSPKDAAARYRALAPALAAAGCDVVAPARWVDAAVAVGEERWPAVVMPWVSGVPLNTAVEDMLDRPQGLRDLADSWTSALAALSAAGVAHGDLQCGNILVDGTGELHLVDLDGFYVPSLGRPPAELGHPDFQHPRRSARDWGPEMDGFSGLVIALSLRALAADPGLWEFNSAENLVLTREDYERPDATPVWSRLRASADPEVGRLAALLATYCTAPTPANVTDVLARLAHRVPEAVAPRPTPPPDDATTREAPLIAPERWWNEHTHVLEPESEQAFGPEDDPVPASLGSWFGRNAVVTGLTSGFLCALLIVAIYALVGSGIPAPAQAPLLVMLAGAVLTAGLTGIPRATMGAMRSAVTLGLGGAGLGVVLSLVAFGGFELIAYSDIGGGRAPAVLVLAWTLCALAIGAAAGAVRRSGRAVVSGLVGGAVGGLVGGLIHWASGPTFVGDGPTVTLEIDVLNPPTLIAICLACAAIGLSIGVVDRVRRRSWLTVIEGRLRGREVILDRREVTIGTDSAATLRLAGDVGIFRKHAVLSGDQRGYAVRCHAAAEINGVACATSRDIPLRTGDVLRIGGSFIRFDQRATP